MDETAAHITAAALQKLGYIDIQAVIVNLYPSEKRAMVAHQELALLGLHNIAIGKGSNIRGRKVLRDDEFAELETNIQPHFEEATNLMMNILINNISYDQRVTLYALSAMTDFAQLFSGPLSQYPGLANRKIKEIGLMSGVTTDKFGNLLLRREFLTPNKIASNNTFDYASAQLLYKKLQRQNIPTSTLSRDGVYPVALDSSIFEELGEHPLVSRMKDMRKNLISSFFRSALAPVGNQYRGTWDESKDIDWFLHSPLANLGAYEGEKTLTEVVSDLETKRKEYDKTYPEDPDISFDEFWKYASATYGETVYKSAKLVPFYDPLQILTSIDPLKNLFCPKIVNIRGIEHKIIGLSSKESGILKAEEIKTTLSAVLKMGLC